jgi:hypothetical protein
MLLPTDITAFCSTSAPHVSGPYLAPVLPLHEMNRVVGRAVAAVDPLFERNRAACGPPGLFK